VNDPAQFTRAQHLWLVAGAIPFLLSIFLLGVSLNSGLLTAFAIGWPLVQVFGYGGSLKLAKGEVDHPLVKTQIVLHWMMLALFIAILVRAT